MPTQILAKICVIKRSRPIKVFPNMLIPTVPIINKGPELFVKLSNLSHSVFEHIFLVLNSLAIFAPTGYPLISPIIKPKAPQPDILNKGLIILFKSLPKKGIKVYVKKIKDSFKGTQIQVTRSNIGFVRKLFELEIPEIASGDIKIKNIARDPGNRTKVAVYTEKQNIDPIGTCVGFHGQRIDTITAELNGEKIDLIEYSDDPLEYIAKALSPAKVISVETNESLHSSRVIVPDDKLSLAIGKNGQNVRLAARLTGWKIEVKPESSVASQEVKEPEYELTELNDDDAFEGLSDLEDLEEISSFDDDDDKSGE